MTVKQRIMGIKSEITVEILLSFIFRLFAEAGYFRPSVLGPRLQSTFVDAPRY